MLIVAQLGDGAGALGNRSRMVGDDPGCDLDFGFRACDFGCPRRYIPG
jgi:hypothetical protein